MNPTLPDTSLSEPPEHIGRSWQRSRNHGLTPETPLCDVPAAHDQLESALEENARLVAYAQPVIANLHQQIARSSSLVLLADARGMILHTLGDNSFVTRAARICLTPGARWDEACMGTNAVGTALVEARPVEIIGSEHYLRRNHILTCIAAPIFAPCGGILGVLDISSDTPVAPVHARALLESTAELIENRLVETSPGAYAILRLNPAATALGTPLDGLIAIDEAGNILASNRRARALPGLPGISEARMAPLPAALLSHWATLRDWMLRQPGADIELQLNGQRRLHARIDRGPAALAARLQAGTQTTTAPAAAIPASSPRPVDALARLDGGDPRMAEAIRRARRIAACDIPLLIQGETGTGKELFAQAFHACSPRQKKPFVAINCAAIPATLIEAELFGHAAGAYTGARRDGAPGRLREADGGTLFLDEIGDMPLPLQATLLRVLETRRVQPLGGAPEVPIDIALICASHRPLRQLCDEGQFRGDLFFRLSGMSVTLPPLREREDFDALVARLIAEECAAPPRLDPDLLRHLRRQRWPGNLRELRNALRLALAMAGSDTLLTRAHLPDSGFSPPCDPPPAAHDLRSAGIRLAHDTVHRHAGNISAAARELGITRTTLYRMLKSGAGE